MFEWRRLVRGKIKIQVLAPLPRSLSRCLTTTLCLAASDQVSAWLLSLSRSVCLSFCPSDQCYSQRKREDVWKAHAERATPGNASQRITETRKRCLRMCVCVRLIVFVSTWKVTRVHMCVLHVISFLLVFYLILFTWMHKTLSLTVLQSMAGISKSPVVLLKTGQL